MKNSFRDRKARPSSQADTFGVTVEEAEICCEQARVAGRERRFRAARGLFSTASALYRQALLQDGVCYESIARRLKHIELEAAAYSELASSLARPLAPTTIPEQSAPRGLSAPRLQMPGAALSSGSPASD